MPDGIFEQYESASWTVQGRKIVFPVQEITDNYSNRIIKRKRPYRQGAKIDDTGGDPTEWTFRSIFHNSLSGDGQLPGAEPGLAENSKPLYPDVLNEMVELFKIHETGDLTVPTIGTVRARAVSYSRSETSSRRDCAEVTFVFCEDNEDNVDAAAFQVPSVSANAESIAEAAEFDEQSEDMWDGSLQDLNELAAQLEGIANAPGDFMQDIESQANIVKGAADKVISAWSKPNILGRDVLLDAEGNKAERKIQAQKELAGQAQQAAYRGRPKTITKKYTTQVSIFDVASLENQEASILLTINPQLEDPWEIPAGTGVRIMSNG
jgi:prophage DNA circulation protein